MTDEEIVKLLKQAFFDDKADFWEIMVQLKRELENDKEHTENHSKD